MEDEAYPENAVGLAAVGTLFFPLIALVAAFLLLAGEDVGPRKRAQLRRWAWVSAVWLVIATATAVLLALY